MSTPELTQDTQIAYGRTVKSTGAGKVGGYLVYFTDANRPDLQGDYFTAQTDFGGYPVKGALALYHHGLDPELGASKIGELVAIKQDGIGLWVEAQLDLANQYAAAIEKMVQRGVLSWSSGALPQSVQVDTDGHIRRWYIVEGSLTPTPAEPFGTRIRNIKSVTDGTPRFMDLLASEEVTGETAPIEPQSHHSKATIERSPDMDISKLVMAIASELGVGELSAEQLMSIVEKVTAEASGDVETAEAAAPDQMSAPDVQKAIEAVARVAAKHIGELASQIDAAVSAAAKSAVAGRTPANSVKRNGVNITGAPAALATGGAPTQIDDLAAKARWANYDGKQLSFMLDFAAQLRNGNHYRASDSFRDFTGKGAMVQTAAAHLLEAAQKRQVDLDWNTSKSLAGIKSMKANELDHTTQTDYGAEFLQTVWRNQLIPDARRENPVLGLIPSFDMAAKIVVEPVQGARGTVYYVPEATADTHQAVATSTIPDSKVTTDNATFTAKKLAQRVGWSAELEEDSIIRFSDYVMTSVRENMMRELDHVVLMGDNATSGNINYDGGTPNGDESWMIFDGIGLAGLANGRDGGGLRVSYADFLAARFLLNREANGQTNNIVFFASPEMEAYLLQMDELVANNPSDVVTAGQIGRIAGIPVVVTSVIQKSASDGKITYNAAGTLSRGIMAFRPGWKVGFRRQVEPYLYRAPDGESWQLTLTARLDLQNSQQTGIASMIYNSLA